MKLTLTVLAALLLAAFINLHAADPVTIDLAKRTWQGIPGLESTAKGRVFVSWFTGGTKEPEPLNTGVLSHSDDGGKTFSAPQAMGLPLSDGTRCYDPCLWVDPKGRLWYLFNRSVKDSTRHGVYARICADPDATPPVWGAEFRVGFDSPFSFRMNKPLVLSSGEWVLPVVHALFTPRFSVGKRVCRPSFSAENWSSEMLLRNPLPVGSRAAVRKQFSVLWPPVTAGCERPLKTVKSPLNVASSFR